MGQKIINICLKIVKLMIQVIYKGFKLKELIANANSLCMTRTIEGTK